MRRALLLALLLATALVPPAGAQEAPPPVLQDPSGDAQLVFAGTAPVTDPAVYTCADLEALRIAEARTELTFDLTLADLKDPNQDPAVDGCRYEVLFGHNGRQFRLGITRVLAILGPIPYYFLDYRDDPAAEYDPIWAQEASEDLTTDTITAIVPRDLLADPEGAAPFPGRVLDRVRVDAYSAFGNISLFADSFPVPAKTPVAATDHMPDDATAAPAFPFQLGVLQTGSARLGSMTPFRASNGEATTFVYNVTARNVGDKEDTYELGAVGVPAGYSLVLPVPLLRLGPQNETTVPVLLTMPFGHQHGSLSSFILEMRSMSDPSSIGRLEMGVRFLAVPQPAGHHDTVYFHSGQVIGGIGPVLQYRDGYFNTLEEDPLDQGAKLHSTGFSMYDVGQWGASWYLRLSPGLEMGLQLDPAKTGVVRIPFGTTFPIMDAAATVTIYAFGGQGDDQFLVGSGESAPFDLGPNDQALVEIPLVPAKEDTSLPYEPGRTLFLGIELLFGGVPTLGFNEESVHIAPGGSAQLPLAEWHDAVDEALAVAGGPALSPLDAQERLVNPGEAVVFPVSVANPLDEPLLVRLEVSGANAEWASFASDSIAVPPHGTERASLIVRAPAGAVDQERADLVLQAFAEHRPEVRGLLRLVAEVDTEADHADDTAAADELSAKESPPAPAGVLLAALALALAWRRRTAGR